MRSVGCESTDLVALAGVGPLRCRRNGSSTGRDRRCGRGRCVAGRARDAGVVAEERGRRGAGPAPARPDEHRHRAREPRGRAGRRRRSTAGRARGRARGRDRARPRSRCHARFSRGRRSRRAHVARGARCVAVRAAIAGGRRCVAGLGARARSRRTSWSTSTASSSLPPRSRRPAVSSPMQSRERGALTVAEARDVLGSTRKYVVPILNRMDAEGVTRRDGETRTVGPHAHATRPTRSIDSTARCSCRAAIPRVGAGDGVLPR